MSAEKTDHFPQIHITTQEERDENFKKRLRFTPFDASKKEFGRGIQFPPINIARAKPIFDESFNVNKFETQIQFQYKPDAEVTVRFEAYPAIVSGSGFTPFAPVTDYDESFRAIYYPGNVSREVTAYHDYIKERKAGREVVGRPPVIDLSHAMAPLVLSISVDQHFSELEGFYFGVEFPGTFARFVAPLTGEKKEALGGQYTEFYESRDSQTFQQAAEEGVRRGPLCLPARADAVGYARGLITQSFPPQR